MSHWAQVLYNALTLTEITGADPEVVALFALFHDSCRVNENCDRSHGARGAEFSRSLRGSLVHLDDLRYGLLWEACCHHTEGGTDGDLTVQVCWDADRLDLARVGVTPQPERLCTTASHSLIPLAIARSTGDCIPGEIGELLGLKYVAGQMKIC